jgi:hypothetical protein
MYMTSWNDWSCQLYKSKVRTKVKWTSLVLIPQSRSWGREFPSPPNVWLTNTVYSTDTFHSIDLEKGSRESSAPPVDCGWEFDTTRHHYAPVRCLNPPAPAAVINLVKCGCKRGCKGTCSCRNTSIPCTEVCGCVNFSCSNQANSDYLAMRDMDEDQWVDDKHAYIPRCVSIIELVCSD